MKYKCDVVRDLMPLAADRMASEASRQVIETHIKTCKLCAKEWSDMKGSFKVSDTIPITAETEQYARAAGRLKRWKCIRGAALTALVLVMLSAVYLFSPIASGTRRLNAVSSAKSCIAELTRNGISEKPEIRILDTFISDDEQHTVVLAELDSASSGYIWFFAGMISKERLGTWNCTSSFWNKGYYLRGTQPPASFFQLCSTHSADENGTALEDCTLAYAYMNDPNAATLMITSNEKTYSAAFRETGFAGVFLPDGNGYPETAEIYSAEDVLLYTLSPLQNEERQWIKAESRFD